MYNHETDLEKRLRECAECAKRVRDASRPSADAELYDAGAPHPATNHNVVPARTPSSEYKR